MARLAQRPPRQGGLSRFPTTVTLAWWQLRLTWRLLLLTGMGIVAAVILVCSVPLYSQVAMSAGLRDTLNTSGNPYVTVHSIASQVSTSATQKVKQQLDAQVTKSLGNFVGGSQFSLQTPGLLVNTYDQVQLIGEPLAGAGSHVQILTGRLPTGTRTSNNGAAIEVALTQAAAQNLHLAVGSSTMLQVPFLNQENKRTIQPLQLIVVGIFVPLSANDVFWHGTSFEDESLGEHGTLYPTLASNDALLAALDLLSTNASGYNAANGVNLEAPDDLYWYYNFDTSKIDVNRIDDLVNGLDTLLATVSNQPVADPYVDKTASSGPADILQAYSDRISVARIPMLSLAYLIAGLVLFFVSLMTDLVVDRQMGAIAILRSRGASRRQIFSALVTQSTGVGIIALIVGPLLAIAVARGLAQFLLSSADQDALNLITADPLSTALGLYLSALITIGVAVLAMVTAIWRATRMDVLSLRRETARTTQSPAWLRMGLDVLAGVIALTGYAFSVYITSPGVLDARTRVLILPPMTLVGATFLLLGCMLLFLRLFPLLLRAVAGLAARARSATSMLALSQMARAPRQSMRMTLLLALAVAFAIFTLIFNASQAQRIPAVVAYQVGADFNGALPAGEKLSQQPLAQLTSAYANIPGVTSATLGFMSSTRASQSGLDISMELRAVDTSTFACTAIWTMEDSTLPLSSLMQTLATRRNTAESSQVIPAIVDAAAWKSLNLSLESPFTLSDVSGTLNFVAIAKIDHIPTVNDSAEASGTASYTPLGGVLVDYQTYAAVAKEVNNANVLPSIAWLSTKNDAASLASVRTSLNTGSLQLNSINDRRAIIANLDGDPLYLALLGVLAIGTTTALLLGLLGNLLVSWLSAVSRLTSFAVMRALGSAPKQIASVLTYEQVLVYATALGLGIAFGFLLSFLVLPAFVFTTLTTNGDTNTGEFYVVQNVPPVQMIIPGVLLAMALGILVAICIAALGMMVRIVSRPAISATLRLNED